MDELIHREISEDIIGAAMKVLNTLKPGLDEKLYENALVIELTKRKHQVDQQKQFPVYYEEHHIGTLQPDLIVDGLVIVDPKVVTAFTDTHLAQMAGYLAITRLKLAILINFNLPNSHGNASFDLDPAQAFDRGLRMVLSALSA